MLFINQLENTCFLSDEVRERTAEYYKKRPCAAKVESAARIFADYLEKKGQEV